MRLPTAFLTAALLILTSCTWFGPSNSSSSSSSSSYSSSQTSSADVVITSPLANTTVTSPLHIVGKAKGPWFFEASLPISIVDSAGQELGLSNGQAQGEWMTTGYVDFTADISFTSPGGTGALVIRKDNPSGLPENDAAIWVPINF